MKTPVKQPKYPKDAKPKCCSMSPPIVGDTVRMSELAAMLIPSIVPGRRTDSEPV